MGMYENPPYYISAYALAVMHGFAGTEEEWLLALQGESAYEQAVAGGYTGTKEQFDTLLAGLDGTLEGLQQQIDGLVVGAMPDGSVTEPKLAGGSVTTEKLAGGAVTPEKTTGLQKQHTAASVTVPAMTAGDTQTVSVTGVTANNTVLVEPAPASFLLWRDCGVRCTAQGAGTLSFAAEDATGESLTAHVLILD